MNSVQSRSVKYYVNISRFMSKCANDNPPLKKGEELTANRERLVLGCQALVVRMARQFARHDEELNDYIQQGNIGLCIAADKYDPNLGAFTTIAAYEINNQMQIFQRRMMYPFSLKAEAYQNRAQIFQLHNQGKTLSEIVKRTKLKKYLVEMTLNLEAIEYENFIGEYEEEEIYQTSQKLDDLKNRLKSVQSDSIEKNVIYLTLSGYPIHYIAKTLNIPFSRIIEIRNQFPEELRECR